MAEQLARLVRLVTAVFAALLYVWFAGVRHAPEVRRRKAERRARRLAALKAGSGPPASTP